jgi:hypothetical protein
MRLETITLATTDEALESGFAEPRVAEALRRVLALRTDAETPDIEERGSSGTYSQHWSSAEMPKSSIVAAGWVGAPTS